MIKIIEQGLNDLKHLINKKELTERQVFLLQNKIRVLSEWVNEL